MGAKMFPHPLVNHVWFEKISFRVFPGKLKSVNGGGGGDGGGGNGPKTLSSPVTRGDLNDSYMSSIGLNRFSGKSNCNEWYVNV